MNKVYIVFGSTGEHSDHTQWNVAVYGEKEMAELHVARANEWLKENGFSEDDDGRIGYEARKGARNPYDRHMQLDYTGAKYDCEEVDFYLHFDQFLELM